MIPALTCEIGGMPITSPYLFPLGTNQVSCTATSSSLPSRNRVSFQVDPAGCTFRYAGIPGQSYSIQCAATPNGRWSGLSVPILAAANGLVQYCDTTSPAPLRRYYRTRAPERGRCPHTREERLSSPAILPSAFSVKEKSTSFFEFSKRARHRWTQRPPCLSIPKYSLDSHRPASVRMRRK